ncbi:MAG: hypothetical protein KJ587_20145 [Alphaproteobacteria bacterium]|nr:hypothetical protein [Alphaproteobacteria bacterium]
MASKLWSAIAVDFRALLTGEGLFVPERPLDEDSRYTWGSDASIRMSSAVEGEPTGGGYQIISRLMQIRRGIAVAASTNDDEVNSILIDAQDTLIGLFLYDGNQPDEVYNVVLVEASEPFLDESNQWIIQIIFRVEYAVDTPQ